MELAFVPLEQSGWRGRGAPRKKASPEILTILRRTGSGQVGVVDSRDATDDEVKELMAELRAGARELGRRIRIQHDPDEYRIRFHLGDAL